MCFYAMMNLHFRDEGWNHVVYDYLKTLKRCLESVKVIDASFFNGLTGLSSALYLCSENGSWHAKFSAKIDDLLIQYVRKNYFDQLDAYLDPHITVPSHFYNLASGLSGIIIYLIYRQDLREFAKECLHALVRVLLTLRIIDSKQVPPWLISYKIDNHYEIKEPYKNGFYSMRVPHGITGVLAALSLALIKGLWVDNLRELIITLVEWIKSQSILKDGLIYWAPQISIMHDSVESTSELKDYENQGVIGIPGISRCLDLASKALKDSELEVYSRNLFLSHLHSFSNWRQFRDNSFALGKAGLLSLVYQMACETENPRFFTIAKEIEENLKLDCNVSHAFCFQSIQYSEHNEIKWINSPGILHGAAGIGLSLLKAQGRAHIPWNNLFFIL